LGSEAVILPQIIRVAAMRSGATLKFDSW
jgi:hypothetical protein